MQTIPIELLLLIIICSCTCGGRTECLRNSKISVVMNFHSKVCKEILDNTYQENENLLIQNYNYTHDGLKTEIRFFDTCGSNVGTSKAVFKSLVWANIDCLKPPYFLGFIGPDTSENLNVAVKMTSALKIPHVINIQPISKYTYRLSSSEDELLLQGIIKLVENFGWKSFTVKTNSKNAAIQNMGIKFIEEATAKDLCILSPGDVSPCIVYFGEIDTAILSHTYNSSIILITEEDVTTKIRNSNSSNSFLILDNIRLRQELTDINMGKIKWFTPSDKTNLDITKVHLIHNAVMVYMKSLNLKCKNDNCFNNNGFDDWNHVLASVLTSYNYDNESEQRILNFKIKEKHQDIQSNGRIDISKNDITLYWNDQSFILNKSEHNEGLIMLKNFILNNNTSTCDRKNNVNSRNSENSIDKYKSNSVIITEMTDSEWWTMVGTVSGVGIAMFTVGFLAVYIVYTNIRGPRNTKNNGKYDFDRDSSLRRVGSDRPTFSNSRNSRFISGLQRRDSKNSIRSNLSEKSV